MNIHHFKRIFVSVGTLAAATFHGIGRAAHVTESEAYPVISPRRDKEEEGSHTHNDIVGEESRIPGPDAVQGPRFLAEDDDGGAALMLMRRPRSESSRFWSSFFTDFANQEEYVPIDASGTEARQETRKGLEPDPGAADGVG